MRYVRIKLDGENHFAVVEGESVFLISGDIFGDYDKTGESVKLSDAKLLAPVAPEKIVCLGINYRDHATEMGHDLPPDPLIFMKPLTSIIGPNDDIVWPAMSERVDYEAELAVVIGRECKNVSVDDAMGFVFGFSCLNDVTARDLQQKDGQWTRGKGFDTFCPIGPWIETELNWRDTAVEARLNGKIVQAGRTSQMINNIPRQISFISQVMTLKPGDIIATGTPSGIGPMARGDKIEIIIEGIGTLTNQLV